jgi:hypothetical protein
MSQVFDPYSSWLDIPPRDHPPDHYALLGLQPFEPNGQVIREAAQQRVDRLRRHRTGEHAEVCQRILQDLSAAAECLLDAGKKSDYDKCLREAQRMDDTRSMSEGDLDVEAKEAKPGPLRWGQAAGKKSAVAGTRPETRTLDPNDSDADSQSSSGSEGSSAGSSEGFATVEATAEPDRIRLITVVVGSTGLGILLVAALGLLAGLLSTHGTDPDIDEQPAPPATLVSADETKIPDLGGTGQDLGGTDPPASPDSPIDSEDGVSARSAEDGQPVPADETAVDSATDSDVLGDESEQTPPDSPPPPPTRLPLPATEEQQRSLAEVEAEFGIDQFVTRGEILDLAEQLIEQARESSQSPDRQFALLLKAARLAGESSDPVLALSAVDEIRAIFEIDDSQIEKLLAEALGNEVDVGRQRWQRFVDARQVLAQDPADPPANLEIGRYYCFLRDDWSRGLPHLAGGEHTALRLLAEKELAEIATWQQRLELGDGWWAVSLVADPEAKAAEQERAARWYRLALPDLEVADKRRVQSRLASLIALPETVPPDRPVETPQEPPPAESEDSGTESAPEDGEQPINLSGTWRSDRFESVFRLDDRGTTVRCEVVSSKMVQRVDGLWIRDKGQLLCDRWRFRFAEDPAANRTWDLGCEPKVVDEKTILIRAEVVEWDRRGRETKRRWETATWRRVG